MAQKKARTPRSKEIPARTRTRKSPATPSSGTPATPRSDEEVARVAYTLWELRGRPIGSPDEDWYQAKERLNENGSMSGSMN
jgi:Protein of unknown function (DUF2934)